MKKTLAMFLLLTTSVIAQSAPAQSPAEIAIANAQKTITKKFQFGNKRIQNIERTAIAALNMLHLLLEEFKN